MERLIACKVCGEVHEWVELREGMVAECVRCGSVVEKRTWGSLHATGAFSLAALILYVPANVFPILELHLYGATTQNTVWQGTKALFEDGDYVIAVVVFLASILIPLLKLVGLFGLVLATWFRVERFRKLRTWVWRVIESVGRWAMLDVFVMAVLVSLVKLQKLATIVPGLGLIAFGGVVVCTLFASASFDSQLIWRDEEEGA